MYYEKLRGLLRKEYNERTFPIDIENLTLVESRFRKSFILKQNVIISQQFRFKYELRGKQFYPRVLELEVCFDEN